MVMNPAAQFTLAQELRSRAGARLGDVFSFVSGLYFRGKQAYAHAFGFGSGGEPGAFVISPGSGLRELNERVTLERVVDWASVSIDSENPRFTEPLIEDATTLERVHGRDTRFVLLGSVATEKYVQPLGEIFGARLLFPSEFVGRGDMSRGALMLQAARAATELAYEPVLGARRRGPRAPSFRASAR